VSSIEHQMTEIYCFVDDFLRAHPAQARWRHSPNREPRFTDAEVITIALLPSSFGCDTLKRAYKLVRDNWRSAFPHLTSYKQWVHRLHALSGLVGQLVRSVALSLAEADNFYLMDSKPIPVCHPIRHGRMRLLREDGAYFGKTSKGWFFGFKLHLLIAEGATSWARCSRPATGTTAIRRWLCAGQWRAARCWLTWAIVATS
jgi:hypothetical protein